ncbi:MAG: ribonuclease III [Vulcanimicrobiaceae bacterium]
MSGEAHRRRLRGLLRLAGVRTAGDLEPVERAFVHESHARERGSVSNERMEFLGDSILGAIAADWVYRHFPGEPEGALTIRKAAIVNDGQLAATARRLGFSDVVQLTTGMRNAGGADNTTVLAGAFEAFVAALYLAYGLERARRFVVTQHVEPLDHAPEALLDPKTRLQNYSQEHLAATPVYRDEKRGTPGAPLFASHVVVKDQTLGSGTGASKKIAQKAAAEAALERLKAQSTT